MDDRALLRALADGPVSGDALARIAGTTRAAVWKRIEALREAGVPVEAAAGRGYRLAMPLDLLDAGAIRDALPAEAAGALAALDVAWTIESTNTALLREPAPASGARVLFAERQTGGRGRRGRTWQSPLGASLLMSVSRAFDGGLARLGGLSLVAGIATAAALRDVGFDAVGLKWPNDVVVEQGGTLRKLGGLLVEGGGEHGGPARAVIGIGLNVRLPESAATAIDQPWIDVATLGHAPTRNALAATLLAHLLPALDLFDRDGFAPFAARWREFDVLHGRDVVLHLPDRTEPARVLGLADDGALRVRTSDGERDVHAGEVSLRVAA
ncbi:bifunctional biotin--[acetyl-CoA-carboxylase] ligase/biotin operon repressor BirA [Lysobacter sp. TY2-98]|uniref:bifunctional biotin--[acetyl-CoA-carboxylase] ligase/biotin operon repressor BirA n=1 Tax=Lysobacter sp. TY2-98 TaxID=2290922 RepID=UPI000E209FA4|nr:bifunctional biotin--[acetyl-CoA-carboxylase] ligase/biotin operon repressor BirA [Lysobacter sp. TY2-98]AXK72872.1 bifunctional biotin--[acetyl-CoA-carboxylase] ligase/biotin operon repressor BirA [Lysobacter sp. TY2-98]